MTAPTQRHALFARRRRRWPSDLLEPTLPSRQLYESAELLDFIREVLHAAVLYRSADPLDAARVTRFDPGDELGWHFDMRLSPLTQQLFYGRNVA